MKKKLVLFDIDYTLFDTEHFKKTGLTEYRAHEEVVEVLEELSKRVELGIFSQGDVDFQNKKLQKLNIKSYFSDNYIHIVLNKEETISEVINTYSPTSEARELYVVDDNLPILHKIKIHAPWAHTVWIKRGAYAERQLPIEGFEPEATINNLRELLPAILKN